MKVATTLSCWLLLLASSTSPVAVIAFTPSASLKRRDLDCNGGGFGSRSSSSSSGDWNTSPCGERGGGEGFRLNMHADGVDDDNENESKDIVHRRNKQHDNSASRPRMVDAECIDGKKAFQQDKSNPYTKPKNVVEAQWIDLKLREIAKKEGYDTTDMGQEELEKIGRWVQSQKVQAQREEDLTGQTRYSSVSLEELQAVALNLGYDPKGMTRDALEQLMDWVQSQKKQENIGEMTTSKTSYSSMPIEELQGIALHEGYDPRKMDRIALEQLMDWVKSPQYHQQKRPLEELRAVARNEGFDPKGMDRGDLEQLINWVQSKQRNVQKQHTKPDQHSRNSVGNSVKSNVPTRSVPRPLEELRTVARQEGYDPKRMKRGDLEKLVDWVKSPQYQQQKRPLEELRAIAISEDYDPKGMDRGALEQLVTWAQSQQYREKKQPLEVLQAVAINEGYDPSAMDRGALEQLMNWVQSQQYHKQKHQSKSHSKNGVSDSTNSKRPTKPLEELRAAALSEGYDPKGMNRSDLEQLMDWIQSPQYREQKRPLEELRTIARNQGFDPKGMDRSDLEQLTNWFQSQQYHKQNMTPDQHSRDCAQSPKQNTTPDKHSRDSVGYSVNSNARAIEKPAPVADISVPAVEFPVPLEELQAIALDEGYQVRGMKRSDLKKLVDWIQSQQYREQKRPLEELRDVARQAGYDPTGMDRGALEQLFSSVQPQQHLQYHNHSRNYASNSVNSNVATVNFDVWPIEQLHAVAINEGYDPKQMSRTELEGVMKWVQSQQLRP